MNTLDAEFLGTPCPDCAVVVAHPELADHLVTVHGASQHQPSPVLELAGRENMVYCLACQQPWPCGGAT